MDKKKEGVQYMEEIKKIVIREKGTVFWESFEEKIRKNEREQFIEGYKYAIRVLEDGIINKNK